MRAFIAIPWRGLPLAGLGLILFLSGCVFLPGFSNLNELPGFKKAPLKEEVFYDKAIVAYRLKEDASKGPVLRNAAGKKIQTEQELDRLISNTSREVVGTGTRYTAYALMGVYTPYNAVAGLFWVLPAVSVLMTAPAVNSAYGDAAEAAYRSGREHFTRRELNEALADWDRAKAVMPQLQATSDVEYWRGRALQDSGKGPEALIAYQVFLSYSEATQPDSFTKKDVTDMTWEEEASDIERRLAGHGEGLTTEREIDGGSKQGS